MNSLAPHGSAGIGNTSLPARPIKKEKRTISSKNWVFTYNNYSENCIILLKNFFDEKCEKYIFEKEVGENNTPHLQGAVIFKSKCRPLEALGKIITNKEGKNSIHWEKMGGSWEENVIYCSKENNDIYKSKNVIIKMPLKLITNLKRWQLFIKHIVESEPDDRSAYWFYDFGGNLGKTALCKYLCGKYGAVLLDGCKKDILYGASEANDNTNIFLFNISKSKGNKICYESIEKLKDGIWFSPKFESRMTLRNPPHIIIFANCPPKIETLSNDRWKIYEINELEEFLTYHDELNFYNF